MRAVEGREYYLSGVVWNMWAEYWTTQDQLIPPLHFMRIGGGEELIFVSAASVKEAAGFLASVKAAAELIYTEQSDWWLPPWRWFGHWSVFSARIRQNYVGIERNLLVGDEVIDYFNSGDSRTIPLRKDNRQAT